MPGVFAMTSSVTNDSFRKIMQLFLSAFIGG